MRPLKAVPVGTAYPPPRSEVSMYKIRQLVAAVLFLATGIFEALKSAKDFGELEDKVRALSQRVACMLLEMALVDIDDRLMRERDKGLEVVVGRPRRIVTTFGELTVRRRLYRRKGTGEPVFLLDEALGLEKGKRLSPRMRELAVELGTEMTFRRAAKVLSRIVPGISAMGVWDEVKAAGERAAGEAEAVCSAVFERGVVPEGGKVIERLYVEADGVVIAQQRSDKRNDEVKIVVGYEGKDGKPRRLVNRKTVAGRIDAERIWEEASAYFAGEWDLSEVREVRVGGDGAEWVKGGLEVFPRASYHLDRYHLRRKLTEGLSFDVESYEEVVKGIAEMDLGVTLAGLDKAMRKARGAARKRVSELRRYILENWDGIRLLPEDERLGTIEGQVRHTICRRMKRINARWSPAGTDRMARLLAAGANDELGRYASARSDARFEQLVKVLDKEAVDLGDQIGAEDLEAWVRRTMPALTGPYASRPWVKYILRTLTSIRPETLTA